MLSATRNEWNELYVLFSLLGKGVVATGNSSGLPSKKLLPIAIVTRVELEGPRQYFVQGEMIRIVGKSFDQSFPRVDFEEMSYILFDMLRAKGNSLTASDSVEVFLEAIHLYDFNACVNGLTDFSLTFFNPDFASIGLRICSRLCTIPPLLEGSRVTNFKYLLTGARLSQPELQKINHMGDADDNASVARRMLYAESLGCVLKFDDAADKVFRSNLSLIDLNFPRIIADMLRLVHLDNVTTLDSLTELIEERNPLKIKEELIRKHLFYQNNIKEFLLACAFGMRPTKTYDGSGSTVGGMVMVDENGRIVVYTRAERDVFSDFLFHNTCLKKGSPVKDKFGFFERENRAVYFKLNLKVGFIKK